MNLRVFKALYLVLSAAIAAGVIYFVTHAGYSFWLAAVVAYLLFFLVNGSLAYVYRARQLRHEGKQPPSYLMYLFFPKGFRNTIRDPVWLPKPIRVVLGSVVALGGSLLLILSGLMLAALDFLGTPLPWRAATTYLILIALGAAFTYVGFRVIIVKNDEPLFKRRHATDSHEKAA